MLASGSPIIERAVERYIRRHTVRVDELAIVLYGIDVTTFEGLDPWLIDRIPIKDGTLEHEEGSLGLTINFERGQTPEVALEVPIAYTIVADSVRQVKFLSQRLSGSFRSSDHVLYVPVPEKDPIQPISSPHCVLTRYDNGIWVAEDLSRPGEFSGTSINSVLITASADRHESTRSASPTHGQSRSSRFQSQAWSRISSSQTCHTRTPSTNIIASSEPRKLKTPLGESAWFAEIMNGKIRVEALKPFARNCVNFGGYQFDLYTPRLGRNLCNPKGIKYLQGLNPNEHSTYKQIGPKMHFGVQKRTGALCTIKTFDPNDIVKANDIVHRLNRTESPHIERIYCVTIQMELVSSLMPSAEPLYRWIEGGPEVRDIIEVLRQVLLAIDELERRHILHKSVDAKNIQVQDIFSPFAVLTNFWDSEDSSSANSDTTQLCTTFSTLLSSLPRDPDLQAILDNGQSGLCSSKDVLERLLQISPSGLVSPFGQTQIRCNFRLCYDITTPASRKRLKSHDWPSVTTKEIEVLATSSAIPYTVSHNMSEVQLTMEAIREVSKPPDSKRPYHFCEVPELRAAFKKRYLLWPAGRPRSGCVKIKESRSIISYTSPHGQMFLNMTQVLHCCEGQTRHDFFQNCDDTRMMPFIKIEGHTRWNGHYLPFDIAASIISALEITWEDFDTIYSAYPPSTSVDSVIIVASPNIVSYPKISPNEITIECGTRKLSREDAAQLYREHGHETITDALDRPSVRPSLASLRSEFDVYPLVSDDASLRPCIHTGGQSKSVGNSSDEDLRFRFVKRKQPPHTQAIHEESLQQSDSQTTVPFTAEEQGEILERFR